MNIVYSCDDKYAFLLGISLTSLLNNNMECSEITIYVVDDGICDNDKEKLKDLVLQFNRHIFFIRSSLSIQVDSFAKWPRNVFYRLFLPSIFRENNIFVDKLLYLDCDTIVVNNLSELYNTDLLGNPCAAVAECMDNFHKKKCGVVADMPYCNSGVLLIDMEKWTLFERLMWKFLEANKMSKLEYPDEEILNAVLKGNICILHPKYNLTSIKCNYSYDELKEYRKSCFMYEEDEYDDALKNPYIIHFTSNVLVRRPWFYGVKNNHYFGDCFAYYKQCSNWRDSIIKEESVPIQRRLLRGLSNKNRHLAIIIIGFLYTCVKPMLYHRLVFPVV